MPRCRSWTCACVQARLDTRSKVEGSRYFPASASASSREPAMTVARCTRAVAPGASDQSATQAEDRVEHRARRVRERSALLDRDRFPDAASTPEKAGPIGLVLYGPDHLPFRRHDLGRPGRLFPVARATAGDQTLRGPARTRSGRRGSKRRGARRPRPRTRARPRRTRSPRSRAGVLRGWSATPGGSRRRLPSRRRSADSSRSARRCGGSPRSLRRRRLRRNRARRPPAGIPPTRPGPMERRRERSRSPTGRGSCPRASA